ncbi:peritrophin-44-like [Haematobia irritans]|uniref:peritrophin-44-like n=1 Tax=Haematobia irritans TaxID=7368 RepID=UPI003F50D074
MGHFEEKLFFIEIFVCIFVISINCDEVPDTTSDNLTELCEKQNFEKLFIPDPSDPHKFIVCTNNVGTSYKCENNECFDDAASKCNANCPVINSNPCSGMSMFDIDVENCQSYYICMGTNQSPIRIQCPDHQHYSDALQKCTSALEADCLPLNKWCKNKPNGLRFEAPKCFEYYECRNGTTSLASCPYNQYFDKDNGLCIPGICTNNDDSTSERIPVCSSANEGLKLPHTICYKYFVCLNGITYTGQCASGYYFHEISKSCVDDVDDICNDN